MALDLLSGAAGAAHYLGLSVREIYHLTEAGRLPVIRLGGSKLYFRKSELDRAFSADRKEAA